MNLRFTSAVTDAAVCAARAHGDRHVRLGLVAEVDRAEVGLARSGLLEARVAGEVDAAADRVHRQPRHPKLLVAGRVEIADLGDRGRPAQQPRTYSLRRSSSGAPARGSASGRRPSIWRSTSARNCSIREAAPSAFSLLDLDERRPLLLVREVQLDQAAGEQRAADQDDEHHHVLAEELPLPRARRRVRCHPFTQPCVVRRRPIRERLPGDGSVVGIECQCCDRRHSGMHRRGGRWHGTCILRAHSRWRKN